MTSPFTSLFTSRTKRTERKRVEAITTFLGHLKTHPFAVATSQDPQKTHAHLNLQDLVAKANRLKRSVKHPSLQDLSRLISTPQPHFAMIDIRSITGVSHTQTNYVGNLYALPETMRFGTHKVDFGPFDNAGMAKLRAAVYAEFSNETCKANPYFRITEVRWSGKRIAHNAGAARRFSLWRRLAPNDRIKALIHPLELDLAALETLLTDWRIVYASSSGEISKAYYAMHALWTDGILALDYDRSVRTKAGEDYWIIPLPHKVPAGLQEAFAELHAKLNVDALEDPLREVCEARSLALRSSKQ